MMMTSTDVGSDYGLDREMIRGHASIAAAVNLQRKHRTNRPTPDAVKRKHGCPDRERALGRGLTQESVQPAQWTPDG